MVNEQVNKNQTFSVSSPIGVASTVIKIRPRYSLFGNAKSHLASSEISAISPLISLFSPITSRIRNTVELHQLLITSSVAPLKVAPEITVKPEQMLPGEVKDIQDEQRFYMGFARKHCSYTPITHLSLAFQDLETGNFLIIGRQNDQFLKLKNNGSDIPFSHWVAKYALNINTLWNVTKTHMDNEIKFHFFPGALFKAVISKVVFTGVEIKALIAEVDKKICSSRYDFVHSNCYSAVIYGLTHASVLVNNKARFDSEAESKMSKRSAITKDLKRLFALVYHASLDNYYVGAGIINNSIVNKAVMQNVGLLEKHEILHIVDKGIASLP